MFTTPPESVVHAAAPGAAASAARAASASAIRRIPWLCHGRRPGSTPVNAGHREFTGTRPILGIVARRSPDVEKRSRIAAARARARGAKVVLGALAALAFGVAFTGAKAHAPGHAKHRAKPLAAPPAFELAVRRSIVAAGQIAPPVQPPPVVTSTS